MNEIAHLKKEVMKRSEELTKQDRLIHSLEIKLQDSENARAILDQKLKEMESAQTSDLCGNFA